MQNETNKATCRSFIQQIFNEGKLSRTSDFITANAMNHELGAEPAPPGRSPEYYAELIRLYRKAFPDLQVEIRDQIAENGRVVTRLQLKGTQENPLLGIPSRGQSMAVEGIRIDRFDDNKIAESWFQWDSVGMLRQLGALPNLWEPIEPSKPAPALAPVWYFPEPEPRPAREMHELLKAS